MIHREVVCRQVRPAILVLVGELDRVEFTVGIIDVAVTVRDQDDGHAQRIVALREVGALGCHAHVVAVEQLLDPPGLLHGQARGLHLVLLLVLLVVEGGDAVGHGHLALHLGFVGGHGEQLAALEAVERVAEIQREVRFGLLDVVREGPCAHLRRPAP